MNEINTMWYIHTMSYLVTERNKILTHAATFSILSGLDPLQKDKYFMIHKVAIKKKKRYLSSLGKESIDQESRTEVTTGWREEVTGKWRFII